MPNWLTLLLRWGGLFLAVVMAVALIYVQALAPTPEAGESTAPVTFYWVLLVIGVVAAGVGFAVGRGKAESSAES